MGGLVLEVPDEGGAGLVEGAGAEGAGEAEDYGVERALRVADGGAGAGHDGGVEEGGGGVPADAVVLGGEGGENARMPEGVPVDTGELDGLVGAAGGGPVREEI